MSYYSLVWSKRAKIILFLHAKLIGFIIIKIRFYLLILQNSSYVYHHSENAVVLDSISTTYCGRPRVHQYDRTLWDHSEISTGKHLSPLLWVSSSAILCPSFQQQIKVDDHTCGNLCFPSICVCLWHDGVLTATFLCN